MDSDIAFGLGIPVFAEDEVPVYLKALLTACRHAPWYFQSYGL